MTFYSKRTGPGLIGVACILIMPQAYATPSEMVYRIEHLSPQRLIVHTQRSAPLESTRLELSGASRGVAPQVEQVKCDGRSLRQSATGVWEVPASCRNLSWNITLKPASEILVADQQSMSQPPEGLTLISEASSLPRLANSAQPVKIRITTASDTSIFPQPDAKGEITLPDADSAPLFIISGAKEAGHREAGLTRDKITLNYLIDNPQHQASLPDIDDHLRALQWLHQIMPNRQEQTFNVTWLGTSERAASGATGTRMLLANYPIGIEPHRGANITLQLYTPLHEAVHQLIQQNNKYPTWFSESLASYYGARALDMAMVTNPTASRELKRTMIHTARDYPDGLIKIENQVKTGNHANYGAFYTKGIAFWSEVDAVLRQTPGYTLDLYLDAVLASRFDERGEPLNLPEMLDIPRERWDQLYQRYL